MGDLKKFGVFLILAGLLCVLSFVLYMFAFDPGIPFLIKIGLSVATIGLIIIIFTLIFERTFKQRKEDEDDYSQY